MGISGRLREKLKLALIETWPTPGHLEQFMDHEFDENLNVLVKSDKMDMMIFKLIKDWALPLGKLGDLIKAVTRRNPIHIRQVISDHLPEIIEISELTLDGIPESKLSELIKLLQHPDLIQPAVKACLVLLPDSLQHDGYEKTIKDLEDKNLSVAYRIYLILILLTVYPPIENKSESNSLTVRFIQEICRQTCHNSNIERELKAFLPNQTSATSTIGNLESLGGYLQIKVDRSSAPGKFSLNCFLRHERLEPDSYIPINLDQPLEAGCQKGTAYAYQDLKDPAIRLIKPGEDELNRQSERFGLRPGRLIIEFFLPYQHLFDEVDLWEIEHMGQKVPIGSVYRVVIRSLDRFSDRAGRALPELDASWRRLEDLRSSDISAQKWIQNFLHIDHHDSFWDKANLQINQKIGIKITCGLPKDVTEQQKLGSKMLRTYLPFAIWTRSNCMAEVSNGSRSPVSKELNKFLTIECFRDSRKLLERILEARRVSSLRDKPEEHLGHHLAILYDDPNRPLPCPSPLKER
jgi:vWA-MoxR associated protein C-terminal domain/Effector-associated domain 1